MWCGERDGEGMTELGLTRFGWAEQDKASQHRVPRSYLRTAEQERAG